MIQNPSRDFPISDKNGIPMDRFIGWIEEVTKTINALTPIDGIGSPEGVLKARQKSYYFDTAAQELYFKTTDETLNTGWVLLT